MIIYLSMIEKEHQRTQFEKIYWENRQLMFWQAKKGFERRLSGGGCGTRCVYPNRGKYGHGGAAE